MFFHAAFLGDLYNQSHDATSALYGTAQFIVYLLASDADVTDYHRAALAVSTSNCTTTYVYTILKI